MIEEIRYKVLYESAMEALENAYAPYSNYKVGAAVLTETGRVFTGCNVENSSYGASICAERVAICNAVSEGMTDITAIAIAVEGGIEASPCGICRQFIFEFGDKIEVVVGPDEENLKVYSIKQLLPKGFRI